LETIGKKRVDVGLPLQMTGKNMTACKAPLGVTVSIGTFSPCNLALADGTQTTSPVIMSITAAKEL
jgi:hypothetical protein